MLSAANKPHEDFAAFHKLNVLFVRSMGGICCCTMCPCEGSDS